MRYHNYYNAQVECVGGNVCNKNFDNRNGCLFNISSSTMAKDYQHA